MAAIKPIYAWRYNQDLAQSIDDIVSPLFDVVSDNQREALYKNPYSSIHLSVPQGAAPAANAKKILGEWKQAGAIVQDPVPGIYVYYQYFTLPGSQREYCRKGFIANIKAYDWDEGVMLRHENTMPKAVNDRTQILAETQLNVSPTHGLYTDPGHRLEAYMDESMAAPIFETEDYQGVRNVMSVIHDAHTIAQFVACLKDKQVILADGHHRYQGSLAYRKQMAVQNPAHTGEEGYNYHLMYLTNTESDHLRILPTHRLIRGLDHFDEAALMRQFEEHFIIKPMPDADYINEIILGKQWAFGLIFKENAYKVRLKPESFAALDWPFPEAIKALDLTVMHYFIIEKILGIAGQRQRTSEQISFDRSFSDCLAKVITNEAQLAIITNEISMEDVKKVCYSGYTMPQKSTYFYPKVICGYLFSSIQDNEFQPAPYLSF